MPHQRLRGPGRQVPALTDPPAHNLPPQGLPISDNRGTYKEIGRVTRYLNKVGGERRRRRAHTQTQWVERMRTQTIR